MSRQWTLPIIILSLCSGGALQANPLNLPGIVYIDGLPCNSACQSYMAWSDQALSARHRGERETTVVAVPAEPELAVEYAPRPRAAKRPAPASRPAPRAAAATSNAKVSSAKLSKAKTSNTRKVAAPNPAYQPASSNVPAATAAVTGENSVAGGQAPERKLESADRPDPGQTASIAAAPPAEAAKPEVTSEVKAEAKSEVTPPPATLEIAAAPATPEVAALPAAAAPALAPRTIQQQVVEATGMADLVTAIGAGREPAGKSDNPAAAPGEAGDAGKTASTSPDMEDDLVALVLARPEINLLSDLNNRNIAIEEKQSASSGRVSAALMAAGAAEVQFSEGQTGAIDRLISGEVPAAVLTLASREAAEWFPDIKGFRTFRVPLKAPL